MKYIRRKTLNESRGLGFRFGLPDTKGGKADARIVLKGNEGLLEEHILKVADKFLLEDTDFLTVDDDFDSNQFHILRYEKTREPLMYAQIIDDVVEVCMIITADKHNVFGNFSRENMLLKYGKHFDTLKKIAERLEERLREEFMLPISVKYHEYSDSARDSELVPVAFPYVDKEYAGSKTVLWQVASGYTYNQLFEFLRGRIADVSDKENVAYFYHGRGGSIGYVEKFIEGDVPVDDKIKFSGVMLRGMKDVHDLSWVKRLCRVEDPFVIYKCNELKSEIEEDKGEGEFYFEAVTSGKLDRETVMRAVDDPEYFGVDYVAFLICYLNSGKIEGRENL